MRSAGESLQRVVCDDLAGLTDRYTWKEDNGQVVQPFPKTINTRNFDGQPRLTEADALIEDALR